jgi:5-methylcytosine-specific restriction protein A
MLGLIRHAVRVAHSLLRERAKEKRSPHWREVRDSFLESHQACAACATSTRLQVHHIKPFHLDHPLELDPSNLIALCMGPNECHIRIGHGDDFKAYNPNVIADAHDSLVRPADRTEIAERAKNARLYTLDNL